MPSHSVHHDGEFLSAIGIAPALIRAPRTRRHIKPSPANDPRTAAAYRLFSTPPFSNPVEILKSVPFGAIIRIRRPLDIVPPSTLVPGSEARVEIRPGQPRLGDLILYADAGLAIAKLFTTAEYDDRQHVPVTDRVTSPIRDAFAVVHSIGPRSVPSFHAGDPVLVRCGLNRWSEIATVERVTARAFHVRLAAGHRRARAITIPVAEIRSGDYTLTISDWRARS